MTSTKLRQQKLAALHHKSIYAVEADDDVDDDDYFKNGCEFMIYK